MTAAIPVAVSGFGSVGKALARRLLAGVPGFELAAIGSRDPARTSVQVERTLGRSYPVLDSRALNGSASILLECAPAGAFRSIVEPALVAGMTVVTISAAALLDNLDLELVAAHGKGRILLASGAIAGLDAIKAARLEKIDSVRMITRKPPQSLARTSWMQTHNVDVDAMTDAVCIFPERREMLRGNFRPTPMSLRRCRSPGPGPIARWSKSGPILRSRETHIPYFSIPTQPGSR